MWLSSGRINPPETHYQSSWAIRSLIHEACFTYTCVVDFLHVCPSPSYLTAPLPLSQVAPSTQLGRGPGTPPCLLQQLDHGKGDLCYQLLSSTSCGDLEWLTFAGSFFPLVLQPLNSTIPEEAGSHDWDLLHESGCCCHKRKQLYPSIWKHNCP